MMVPSTGSTPFVDTVDALKYVLNQISALRKKSPGHDDPFIYMDFEGHNLGARDGTLSIVQLLLAPLKQIVFIDVLALRKATFETAGKDGTTLKDIIEDARFPIGFWAIGNDAANLWDEYKIMFRGVKDAQMAISYRVLNGLTKVIRRCVELTDEEAKAVNAVKDTGMMIFRGNNNRSAGPLRRPNFRSFVMRPLHADLVRYCFIDVVFLPMVWKYFTENRDVVDMEDLQLKIDTRVQWSTETYIQKLERRKDGDTELPNTDAMEKRMAERGYQHEEVTVDDMKKMLFTGRWDGRLRSAGDDGDAADENAEDEDGEGGGKETSEETSEEK